MDNNDENGMSKHLKGLATFINRVGYPVAMSIFLCYLLWFKLGENTKAINDLKEVMTAVKDALVLMSK